ncbi:BTAD domain-containing putative transcriptional regulator [Spirilliplanes yamanashiensis]|uniref:BTAD domain-containing putative transcriptional regulator n=1 Tax=Spirilliplanes yamanashiensis TaxID=42233 RepID=UPI001951AB6E|nr:BTAD domain-containing putative transcriptional regulator [Spirilliplanes yamanashiensis]MDP9815420.1 DNA-binding SARP family transcriptional activator [Spirilliplanes yamanashiensis]
MRARLFDQLDQTGTDRPALVVAPAGFGKTTLLAQYAHRHDGPVVTYHADAMDAAHGDTAVRLVEAVRAAARRAKADTAGWPDARRDDAADRAEARAAVAAARDPATAVTEAMAAAAERAGGLLVTLDNLDQLTGTPGEQVVSHVLARRPRGVQLVLGTRRMPRLNLLRHELAGETALVGPDDLRLRRWEVERLLDEVYGEPLPADGVALLTRRTGGWPAALALFHLATRGRPLVDRYKAAASPFARWPAFRQYFADTVLAGVAPHIVDFLLRTCPYERLTAERCAKVSDLDPALLDDLAQVHALPVTGRGDTYRYETAFRGFLEALHAERLGGPSLNEAHRRAGELLLAEEAYPEAARAFARAGDWTQLQLLLAEHGRAAVEPPTAELIELVPEHLRRDEPWFAYAEAVQHLLDAQLQDSYEDFDRAARLFGEGRWHRASTRQKLGVGALVAPRPPRGVKLHWTGWLRIAVGPHAVESIRDAELAPAESELIRLVAGIFGGGVPEGITRDTREARMGRGDSLVAVLGLHMVRTAIEVTRGRASTLALERVADEADQLGLGWVARLALACRALGGGTYSAADAYAVAAESRRAGDRWGYLLTTAVGSISEIRTGRIDPDRLTALAAEARELAADAIAEWALAFIALGQARRGEPGAAALAREAVERAEKAGVPGAAVVATLALSVTDPVRRPSLLREAAVRAEAAGLAPAVVQFWHSTYAAQVVAQPAPVVTIHCFGGFRMEIAGRPLDLSAVRPRARSALRLLAMRAGRYVHREVLIEALWSDLAPAAATRNLQVTISALRGLLEPASGRGKAQLLVRSGDAYGLVLPPGAYADTAAFTEAVQRWQQMRRGGTFAAEVDAMRAALAAYGGDLLPEEGPADWAVEAREEFRNDATRVARELATAELSQGHVAEAVRAAEQCIALDPHDDEAWQVLLRAYARSATPAKAADARRRYADMLAGLGVTGPTPQQLDGIPRQLRRHD